MWRGRANVAGNVSLAELRRASLRFAYRVLRDDVVLATGETTHACLGLDGKLQRFPVQILHSLTAGEEPQRASARPALQDVLQLSPKTEDLVRIPVRELADLGHLRTS